MRIQHRIEIAADMDAMVGEAVTCGEYSCPSEVIEHALALWSERRRNFGYTLDELRTVIHRGNISCVPHLSDAEIRAQALELIRSKRDKPTELVAPRRKSAWRSDERSSRRSRSAYPFLLLTTLRSNNIESR